MKQDDTRQVSWLSPFTYYHASAYQPSEAPPFIKKVINFVLSGIRGPSGKFPNTSRKNVPVLP